MNINISISKEFGWQEYIFDDYEQVRQMWWNYDSSMLKYVEVIDKVEKKKSKGFG